MRMSIMGQTGSGKTSFIATIKDVPDMKALLVDFDGSADNIISPTTENIDIAVIGKDFYEEVNEIYEYLVSGDHSYNMVIFDSFSEYNQQLFNAIVANETATVARRKDTNKPEIQDYLYTQMSVIQTLDKLLSLPMHFVATVHPARILDEVLGHKYVPLLQPKKLIPGLFSRRMTQRLYLAVDADNNRVLLLNNYPKFDVLTRVPEERRKEVPDQIAEPTFAKLMKALVGEYDSSDAPLRIIGEIPEEEYEKDQDQNGDNE